MIKTGMTFKRFFQLSMTTLPILLVGCHHPDMQSDQAIKSPPACAGNAYLTKYDCSVERIQRAAEEGSADAQYALGYMYYYGISTMRDQETAVLWIKRAADQGQPLAKKALELIQSGSQFSDLHRTATQAVGGRTGGPSLHQPPANVEDMNTATPTEPITNHLPGYQSNTEKKEEKQPVLDVLKSNPQTTTPVTNEKSPEDQSAEKTPVTDPRLSQDAKAIVAPTAQKTDEAKVAAIPENTAKINIASMPKQAAGAYTVQLMGSHHLPVVQSFVKKYALTHDAHVYQTKLNHQPWYFLTYGNYKTESQAKKALRQLPKQVQQGRPWVKSLHAIKEEIRLQKVVG